MKYVKWLRDYFELYKKAIFNEDIYSDLIKIKDLFYTASQNRKKVIFVGNGGSAAMASHCAVDLTKNAKIRAINFNEADLITCLSNDRGYEHWVAEAIKLYGDKGDVAVFISSSGSSKNIINGAMQCREIGIKVVTLSGFNYDNPLRELGSINIWVNSYAYNIVEMTHHIWLLAVVDMIIGKAEYSL